MHSSCYTLLLTNGHPHLITTCVDKQECGYFNGLFTYKNIKHQSFSLYLYLSFLTQSLTSFVSPSSLFGTLSFFLFYVIVRLVRLCLSRRLVNGMFALRRHPHRHPNIQTPHQTTLILRSCPPLLYQEATRNRTRTTAGVAGLVFTLGASAGTGGATVARGGVVALSYEGPQEYPRATGRRATSGARGWPAGPLAIGCTKGQRTKMKQGLAHRLWRHRPARCWLSAPSCPV